MSETSEGQPTNIDPSGEIIRIEKPSRWDFLKNRVGSLVRIGRWGIEGIRQGYWRPPKPGQVTASLEAIKAKLDVARDVSLDSKGNIIPQTQNLPPK